MYLESNLKFYILHFFSLSSQTIQKFGGAETITKYDNNYNFVHREIEGRECV